MIFVKQIFQRGDITKQMLPILRERTDHGNPNLDIHTGLLKQPVYLRNDIIETTSPIANSIAHERIGNNKCSINNIRGIGICLLVSIATVCHYIIRHRTSKSGTIPQSRQYVVSFKCNIQFSSGDVMTATIARRRLWSVINITRVHSTNLLHVSRHRTRPSYKGSTIESGCIVQIGFYGVAVCNLGYIGSPGKPLHHYFIVDPCNVDSSRIRLGIKPRIYGNNGPATCMTYGDQFQTYRTTQRHQVPPWVVVTIRTGNLDHVQNVFRGNGTPGTRIGQIHNLRVEIDSNGR